MENITNETALEANEKEFERRRIGQLWTDLFRMTKGFPIGSDLYAIHMLCHKNITELNKEYYA